MGVNFSESIGTLKPWGSYILNEFYKKRMVQAPKSENDGLTNIIGGFVRDPIVGQHKWIVSEDVNSMYPLLSMVSFNMSPETFIPVSKAPPEVREMILTHYIPIKMPLFYNKKEVWIRIDLYHLFLLIPKLKFE